MVEYLTRADARLSELLDQSPAGASWLGGCSLEQAASHETTRTRGACSTAMSTAQRAMRPGGRITFNDAARRLCWDAAGRPNGRTRVLVVRDECQRTWPGCNRTSKEGRVALPTLAAP